MFKIMKTHLSPELKEKCPQWVSWSIVCPHQEQAQKNHSQTLERLSERGGLAPDELVAVMEGRSWKDERLSDSDAVDRLNYLIHRSLGYDKTR